MRPHLLSQPFLVLSPQRVKLANRRTWLRVFEQASVASFVIPADLSWNLRKFLGVALLLMVGVLIDIGCSTSCWFLWDLWGLCCLDLLNVLLA